MEWVLVDAATNSNRGATERIQEKTLKIATKAMELAGKGESVPSSDHSPTEVTELREAIRVLREEKRVLEERVGEGERRAELAEARAVEAEERGNTLVREELASKGESVPSPDHTPTEITELRETIRVLREEKRVLEARVGEGERRAETERTDSEANDRPDTDSRELEELAESERSPETAHLLEQQANERAQSPAAETKGDTQGGIDQQHTQEATGDDPSSNTKPPQQSSSRTIKIDRKFNLVIYGIPEDPTGLSRLKRHQNDLHQATDIIHSIDDSIPFQSIRDCYRLGKYKDHAQPRPLRVIMTEKSYVNSILSKGDKLLSRPYSVKPDMSPEDLAANKLLLKERWSLMESGVDKKDIKIVRNSLYVRHQPHARVRGSQLVRPPQQQQQQKHGDSSSTPSQSDKDSPTQVKSD